MAVPAPRDLLTDPRRFGHLGAEWRGAETAEEQAELAAAYFTHQAVQVLRRSLAEQGLAQTELARRLGVKPETLGRKIRGESWASLKDVISWAFELGIDLLPNPESREELLPY